MASYKTHTHFNIFFILPVALGGLYLLHIDKFYWGIFGLSFAYATLFMNPDVDLSRNIKFFSFRGLMTLPFRSYSHVFHHRGLSHNLFLGSLTRILWLALWIGAIFFIVDLSFSKSLFSYFIYYKKELLFSLLGIMVADFGHLVLDWHSH